MAARKVQVQTGAHVEIEPGRYAVNVWAFEIKDGMTYEQVYARKLEAWAKEVQEFFRDHRHQDVNSVHVVREYESRCSECDSAWETMHNDESGNEECAYCGAYVSGPNPPAESPAGVQP